MEWLKELQVPGLVLAAGVIVLLFQLLGRLLTFCFETLRQRTEDRALLLEMSGMLKQICYPPPVRQKLNRDQREER